MYLKYLKEREGIESVTLKDKGFATYELIEFDGVKCCYIIDIWIAPEHRSSGYAGYLADRVCEIAKKQGAKQLIGTVVPTTNGSTESIKVLLSYGFKLLKCESDKIYFIKGI